MLKALVFVPAALFTVAFIEGFIRLRRAEYDRSDLVFVGVAAITCWCLPFIF